jgi:predicted CXXCH cytochrome family protein
MKTRGRTMKRILFIALGSAMMVPFGAGAALADNGPHISTAGAAGTTFSVAGAGANRCAGCHRAHTAKDSYLLKQAQPALCYSCHSAGGTGAGTDVANGKDDDTGAALRGGGFDFALIGSGAATKTLGPVTVPDPVTGVTPRQTHSATIPAALVGQATTSKHQIDGVTTGTMWGNGAVSANIADAGKAGVTLECGSCHDPHGNGNYRILKPIPNDAGPAGASFVVTPAVLAKAAVLNDDGTVKTAAVPAVPAVMSAAGVVVPDSGTKSYTTSDYWKVGDGNNTGGPIVAGKATDGFIANVSQWCSTCHTRYLAPSGSYQTPQQNAAGVTDANFTYRHRSDSVGVEKPNCIQCHVSHGSNAQMTGYADGVAQPDGATAPPGDSRLLRVDNRGTCVMCHNV